MIKSLIDKNDNVTNIDINSFMPSDEIKEIFDAIPIINQEAVFNVSKESLILSTIESAIVGQVTSKKSSMAFLNY
jgi:hypothetical protein